MNKQINITIISIFVFLLSIGFASAMIINSVNINKLYPGKTASLEIDIKNNLNEDADDVSLVLDLDGTLFTTVGSSEDSEDEIKEGDIETFSFTIKSSPGIKPGDYNIPYTLTYVNSDNNKTTKKGSFGISVAAKTELNYGVELKNNVVGETGTISLKIVNSGLGDIRFVSVKIISKNGFEVVSSDEEYVGNIDSDDFELATFDVIYEKTGASITAEVEYKDFDNNQEKETVAIPITVYSKEKALELGLIQKPNYTIYLIVGIVIVGWIIYRKIKKNRKNGREK
ncbi:MAG: hypothetical protein AABX88_00180 [Nanoarchaeota archaeon]